MPIDLLNNKNSIDLTTRPARDLLAGINIKEIKTSIPFDTEISAPKKPWKSKPMTTEEQAEAQNIGSISRDLGQRLSQVASQYKGKTPETGLRRTFDIGMLREPTTKQLAQTITKPVIDASIIAGGLTSPLATLKGLALGYPVFKGIDIATQKVEERLPEKTPPELKEMLGTGGYLGGLYVGGKILQGFQGRAEQTKPAKLAQEATEAYRNILRPNQSEVKNIEIRKGKNIDDYYRLAAEEQLPIKQTSDKKLDTTLARQKLQPKIEEIHNQLNSALETRQNKFNLKTLAVKVKLELSKTIKNAKELKDAQGEVDNYINSEIERYGVDEVSPLEFNNIKQGMWSVAYDMLRPTSKVTARKIGFVAKEMIESSYPSKDIKGLNELSGKYQTLNNLLENAQGRVIQGGRLGKYFAQTIGTIAGAALPLPGIGKVGGALAGKWVGGKISEHLASPERISKIASKKMQKSK